MEFILTVLFWSVVVGGVGAALWQQNFRRQFMNLAETQASRQRIRQLGQFGATIASMQRG